LGKGSIPYFATINHQNHRKMNYLEGKSFKTVIFNYGTEKYKHTFKVKNEEFLLKFTQNNVEFIVRYDEQRNTIDVFTDNLNDHVYRRLIK